MTNTGTNNDFLVELLALQQDGKQAISAPTNWVTQHPLLEVETEVDNIINDLAGSVLLGNNKDRLARWHFFIGSPGNGKSAAVGKLCRKLIGEFECRIVDESDTLIKDLKPTAIPYALDVYEKDNRFASVRIVQDASVVRNPFSPDIDPARELTNTLTDAWERGISLVICTNRGILEKAHTDNHTDPGINRTPWFKILRGIVNNALDDKLIPFDAHKKVFSNVKVTYNYLDNRSLFVGSDIFERLVKKAIEPTKWETCSSCEEKDFCPYKANRDWLADQEARKKVLRILQRAEAFSGQVIVFRESLALISLVLTGCPRDYESIHPCAWVKKRAREGDIFSLATRRIYMSFFAPYSFHGLETSEQSRKKQLDALRLLQSALGPEDSEIKKALGYILDRAHPSTDVGIGRLLGAEGVLARINPLRGPLPPEFYDAWDSDYTLVKEHDSPLVTGIERRCADAWIYLEQVIEAKPGYEASELHWALRRWSSNYFLHLGALFEGRTAWSSELDEFIELLDLLGCDPSERTPEETRKIRRLDDKLQSLLNATGSSQQEQEVPISESAKLVGRWVSDKLRPRVTPGEKSGGLLLSIRFDGGETTTFAAPMYLWLSRRESGRLDLRCLPPELISGVNSARIRAAAKGRYAFENDDVQIKVNVEDGKTLTLARFEGDVDVSHD